MTQPIHHHDQRPGRLNLVGQQKPEELVRLGQLADDAWQAHSNEVDRQLCAGEWDRNILDDLLQEARDLQQAYYDACTLWHSGYWPIPALRPVG